MTVFYVALSLCFFGWSLLALVPTPTRVFWKPAVAATEWGHWLGALTILAALVGLARDRGSGPILLFVVASGLFFSPLARSLLAARGIRERLAHIAAPGAGSWAPRQHAPVVLTKLGHIPIGKTPPVRHVYAENDGASLALDLYAPAVGREKRTLVIVVHGGSWSSGDSRQLAGMNRYLRGQGYPVAALNTRLAPRFTYPAPVEDVERAIRFLAGRRLADGPDWDRVVVLGRSSGGHVALLAAYEPVHPSISGVIALYAPTDLVWSWRRPAPDRLLDSNRVIRDFLGGSLDEMPERFRRASPIHMVRSDLPPTLLVHGGNDELVSPRQSRRLARELARVGAPAVHIELPWGKHGMDANLAGPSGQITLYAVERFLRSVDEPAG